MASPRADDASSSQGGFKTWFSSFGTRAMSPQRPEFSFNTPSSGSIFGQPLRNVLKCSSVPIRLADVNGEPYIWGYIPAIVAKTGLYLKQHGLTVEGVFRVGGSEKRVRELQDIFDTAPHYGKIIDWSPYTVHDAAGVLRRYLTQMPEPIIPKSMSRKFCRVMTKRDLEQSAKIEQYRRLIISIPQANQYLLLYILDLLAVVEHNSNKNKMTAQNLAIVFQPSILSHPNLSSKDEHLAAVEVIEFLIEHQDHFVLALSNPPPKDVPPEELTSQIPSEIEDYVIIPSDSDEEVSEYQVHVGGGSFLAKPQTSHQLFGKFERKKRMDRMPTTPTEEEVKSLNLTVGHGTSPQRPGYSSPLFTSTFFRRRSCSQTDGTVDDQRLPPAADAMKSFESRSSKSTRRPSIRVSPPTLSVKPERSVSSNGADQMESKHPYTFSPSPVRSDECLVSRVSRSDFADYSESQNQVRLTSSRPPFRKSYSARNSSRHSNPSSPETTFAPLSPSNEPRLSAAPPLEKIQISPAIGPTHSMDRQSASSQSSVLDALGPVMPTSKPEVSVPWSHGTPVQNSLGFVPKEASLSDVPRNLANPLGGSAPSFNNTNSATKENDLNIKFAKVVLTLSTPKQSP